jgi:hypothetical protein
MNDQQKNNNQSIGVNMLDEDEDLVHTAGGGPRVGNNDINLIACQIEAFNRSQVLAKRTNTSWSPKGAHKRGSKEHVILKAKSTLATEVDGCTD